MIHTFHAIFEKSAQKRVNREHLKESSHSHTCFQVSNKLVSFPLIWKWRWIGHILRKPANNITRQALRWNPQGKRKRGRPRNSWRRGVESQMRNWGHTWATLGRFAQDRTRWRMEVVNGLCSNRS